VCILMPVGREDALSVVPRVAEILAKQNKWSSARKQVRVSVRVC
jgi:hypothetical protein